MVAMRILVSFSIVAAAVAAHGGAVAQENAPFCLKSGSGVTNCIYQTMAACEQVKQSNDQCLTSAQAGTTTGLGSTLSPPPPPQPAPGSTAPQPPR
jgi:hypothetical protein